MEKKKKSEEEEDDENLKKEEKDIKGKGKGKGKVAGGLCQIFVLTSTGSGRYGIALPNLGQSSFFWAETEPQFLSSGS